MKLNSRLTVFCILLVVFTLLLGSQALAADDGIKVALQAKVQTLDPGFLKKVQAEWPVMNCIYNGLVKYKPGTFEVVPDLATDWEISDDNTEITFHLREGVQFHKGYGELTAEDVKFTYERIIAPENKSPEAQSFANLIEVEVVDKYTAKLILEEPMGRLFTASLPFNAGLIVSKKAVEEMGNKFSHNPVGTGPYAFAEWGINNNIVLTKNEDYWNKAAKIAEVEFIPMPDPTSQEMALQSGEINIGEVTLDNIDKMKKKEGLEVASFPDLAIQYIAFNCAKEPMNNKDLREAIRYIIDPREILIGAFAGQAARADSLLLADMLGYWGAPDYDIEDVGEEKVWEMLEKAGYPEGKGLQLKYVTDANEQRRLIATLIQAQLAEFNIGLEIEALEIGPKIEKWQEGSYDILYTRFANTVDPGYAFQWDLTEQIGKWNLFQWSNKEYDRLWKEAEATMDTEKRSQKYVKMQKLMDEDVIGVYVTHGVRTPAWTTDIEPVFSPDGVVLPWLVEKK